jgi:hypothetical protein
MAESRSAIVKLAHTAQRATNALKKKAEESQEVTMRGVHGFEVLVGGGLGGLADGLAGGELAVVGAPVVPVVGAVMAVTALINYTGSSHVGAVGIGATSYWLGKFIREAF